MNKKSKNVSLKLNRETLVQLSDGALRDVAGGGASVTCSNNSCEPGKGTCRLN